MYPQDTPKLLGKYIFYIFGYYNLDYIFSIFITELDNTLPWADSQNEDQQGRSTATHVPSSLYIFVAFHWLNHAPSYLMPSDLIQSANTELSY